MVDGKGNKKLGQLGCDTSETKGVTTQNLEASKFHKLWTTGIESRPPSCM